MTMYLAVMALCMSECRFFYSNDLFESKEKCFKSVYISTKELPEEVKVNLQTMCIPINLGKIT